MLPVTSHLVTLYLLVGLLPFSPKFMFSRRCACVVRPIRQTGLSELPNVTWWDKRAHAVWSAVCCASPGVCALFVVNIHRGLWFAVCCACVPCVCAVRVCCRIGGCCCGLLWGIEFNKVPHLACHGLESTARRYLEARLWPVTLLMPTCQAPCATYIPFK